MTYLESVLLHEDMVEAIKEARWASQALYGFTGGEQRRLGRAIYKLQHLLDAIEHYEEEDDAEDPNPVSA